MIQKTSLETAREYEARLEQYLEGAPALPLRAGKVNATAVASACGFDRQILYKNKTCRNLLEAAARRHGVPFITPSQHDNDHSDLPELMVPIGKLQELQRRVDHLEKRMSEMTARNAAMRAQLQQHNLIEDHLISSGRRSRPTSQMPLFIEGEEN